MTFTSLGNEEARKAIDHLAAAPHLAGFVGAGVSAESGLPPWSVLVRRLLNDASEEAGHFENDEQREDWIERTLASELPAGAAGIAQTLLGNSLTDSLKRNLYRAPASVFAAPPSRLAPGQTAHAVAALRLACDKSPSKTNKMKILTTNYDDLLERALRERDDVDPHRVRPVVWPMPRKRRTHPDDIKVHHLHGFLPPRGNKQGNVVLTDRAFNSESAPTRARDSKIREILSTYSCLFLGTSFSDPNIIRYLDQATSFRRDQVEEDEGTSHLEHVAIFTHHSEDPQAVLRTRESIARARLSDAMTRVVFLDHYSDVAQFVFELRARICEEKYVPQARRAQDLLRRILRNTIMCGNKKKYDAAQPKLNDRLTDILLTVLRSVDRDEGTKLAKEPIAAALWLLDVDGTSLTPWLTTDRIHRDPALLQALPVEPHSHWLAVRAVCEGTFLGEPKSRRASRWNFIAGFPLRASDGGDSLLPIGALTLSTLEPEDKTQLAKLTARSGMLLRDRLNSAVSDWLLTASA